jgi:MFS family permease
VLFLALFVGFVAGLAAGGRIDNLASVRLRWPLLIFGAVIVRLGTELALTNHVPWVEAARVLLLGGAYGLLGLGLWRNRALPGIGLALVGIALNATAILLNGGHMPVWQPSLVAAGFGSSVDALSSLHVLLPAGLDASFLAAAGPLGDIIPVPLPVLRNVLSIGDMILTAGLALFLFTSLLRQQDEPVVPAPSGRVTRPELPVAHRGGATGIGSLVRPRTGLLGNEEGGLAVGGAVSSIAAAAGIGSIGLEAGRSPGPGRLARARTHPYARVAANSSFMTLWFGQLISLFGDRIHQVALAFLVLGATGSAVAVSLVFVAATLPNLLFGPLAGVLVDRWDQKRVLFASDALRAVIVVLMPPAVIINVVLVYPLVFVLTTVSVFFRPARSAVVPRLVNGDELVTANSLAWLGETLADVVGYPLAGLFVAFLANSLPLAFWMDGATYVASAALVFITRIPPADRSAAPAALPGIAGLRAELTAGLRFLRGERVLWANTLQAVVGQFTIGATIALTPLYAERILAGGGIAASSAYAFMETGVGVGNLIGGFVIGLLGPRLAKGPMVIAGYVGYGVTVVILGLTGNVATALGLSFGMGVANMVFVIPTQTLFQERTPEHLMGRVLSFRFAAVFGSMTAAMAVSGLLGEALGISTVFVLLGGMTTLAGVGGLLSRGLRRA